MRDRIVAHEFNRNVTLKHQRSLIEKIDHNAFRLLKFITRKIRVEVLGKTHKLRLGQHKIDTHKIYFVILQLFNN